MQVSRIRVAPSSTRQSRTENITTRTLSYSRACFRHTRKFALSALQGNPSSTVPASTASHLTNWHLTSTPLVIRGGLPLTTQVEDYLRSTVKSATVRTIPQRTHAFRDSATTTYGNNNATSHSNISQKHSCDLETSSIASTSGCDLVRKKSFSQIFDITMTGEVTQNLSTRCRCLTRHDQRLSSQPRAAPPASSINTEHSGSDFTITH